MTDPFAVFPDSLPAVATVRTRVEARELYRRERGAELQDYDLWNTQALALVRNRNAWIGVRHGTAGLAFDQRNVYDESDVFRGRRRVEHLAVAVAARPAWGEVRALLGGSSGLDAAVQVRGLAAPGGALSAWAWWWRGGFDISQKIRATTFFFPFRYHERAAGAEWERARRGPLRWRVRAAYRGIAGEEPYDGQYNRLDIHRLHLAAAVAPEGRTGWDAALSADGTTAGCEMTLDGTTYARVRDVRGLRFGGEAGWRAWPSVRVFAGTNQWRVRCDDPGFVDVWPFTVWDVFLGSRYRLESIDAHLGVIHAGASWSPRAGRFSWDLGGRWEWWDSDGDLFWKERVATLPPFFFRFDHHRDDASLTPTNGAQADASMRCDVGRAFVRLEAQLVAPLGNRGRGNGGDDGGGSGTPDPASDDSEPESVRGGLRVVVVLGADW